MKTIQAYRFALDVTPAQERTVLAHAGAARVAHNGAAGTTQGFRLAPERTPSRVI